VEANLFNGRKCQHRKQVRCVSEVGLRKDMIDVDIRCWMLQNFWWGSISFKSVPSFLKHSCSNEKAVRHADGEIWQHS